VASSRNARSAAALDVFVRIANCIPLYFSEGSLRRHMELRGRLLTAWAKPAQREVPAARPRDGRRLRIGVINRHFGSQTETYTTLPTFEQLDPERFEVQLFACHGRDTALEKYAAGRATAFTVLPGKIAEQLAILRAAQLDVAVFGTNVTAVTHEITQLALHRVAPLQVVNNSSCTTTGFPEIDLYVSGDSTEREGAAADFSERLGLVRGPAHAFNYEADRQAPSGTWTREMLGMTAKDIVFVSAANFFKITPEMQHTWARLLAAVPGSRLLLHPFNPNWASQYPVKRFCAAFDRVLAEHGVAGDRLAVSTVRLPSRTDVRELMRLGDLYLDTFPFAGVNSLVDPLEAGVPVISWEGETFRSRMGAALLRELGLDELVVNTEAGYHALAVRLAGDAAARVVLRERITGAMSRQPLFLDTSAASEAFGALLEKSYDELVARGRDEFRRDPRPIVAPPVRLTVRIQGTSQS
jgi:predicted O-linked N-acetylglucosamine transferase (SPINDLY family)